jgi:galactokinase
VNPVCTLAGAYHGAFDSDPRVIARAPARVNLLGEHVDYNDGWVLPAAIEQGAWVAASPNSASHLHLRAADFKATVSIPLADLHRKVDMQGRALPTWALYPAGVAWALQQRGLTVGGIDALYTSDVPIGAGLSSSAAVEVAFAMTWQALGGWDLDKMELAQACRHAENAFVGVPCGLMDQFSSMHGVASHVLFFDCRTLHWEAIPLTLRWSLQTARSAAHWTIRHTVPAAWLAKKPCAFWRSACPMYKRCAMCRSRSSKSMPQHFPLPSVPRQSTSSENALACSRPCSA